MRTISKELKDNSLIVDVNGIGMEIGIQLNLNNKKLTTKKIVDTTYEKGLHLCKSSETGLQLMPPLTIERKILNSGLEILIGILKSFSK